MLFLPIPAPGLAERQVGRLVTLHFPGMTAGHTGREIVFPCLYMQALPLLPLFSVIKTAVIPLLIRIKTCICVYFTLNLKLKSV